MKIAIIFLIYVSAIKINNKKKRGGGRTLVFKNNLPATSSHKHLLIIFFKIGNDKSRLPLDVDYVIGCLNKSDCLTG